MLQVVDHSSATLYAILRKRYLSNRTLLDLLFEFIYLIDGWNHRAMVVINHCTPHQLNAYSTVPLSQSVTTSVQHDFAIGSFARFGNPVVALSIQDRQDFHGASHYSMREKLDLEGFLENFLIIDDRTADSHAIWYVETTETSKEYAAMAAGGDTPPITHEREAFPLYQARILTQDVPIQWALFDAGVSDLENDLEKYNHPYDPHNPQLEPFTLGLDFSRREDVQGFLIEANIKAAFEEINWSTDIELRKRILPNPPVVVQLTQEAAREAGLLSKWRAAQRIPGRGETVSMTAPYDWDSPKWVQDGMSVAKRRSRRSLSLLSLGSDTAVGTCQSRMLLGQGFNGFRDLTTTSSRLTSLLRHKVNAS